MSDYPVKRDAFREWLRARSGQFFHKGDCKRCPLATYASAVLGRPIVSSTIRLFEADEFGVLNPRELKYWEHDEWAVSFVVRADEAATTGETITADECLRILDRIESLLTHQGDTR